VSIFEQPPIRDDGSEVDLKHGAGGGVGFRDGRPPLAPG
jgi:hypothetical protein